jgi:hypothetical protein
MNITHVFICYRHVDGKEVAAWLHEQLDGLTFDVPGDAGTVRSTIQVYFDQATPAVSDWQALHGPSLQASHSLLVVCSPGLFSRLGSDDWVHAELGWWLKHRTAAPILVDTTGESGRWVPPAIMQRWPRAQRLDLDLRALQAAPEAHRTKRAEFLVRRIVNSIAASDTAVRFEDLERQKALLERQRRYLRYVLAGLLATTLASVAAFWFSRASRLEAERSLASTLLQQANYAWEMDNKNFAKILSAEALAHDRSQRVRDGAAAIHYWYGKERRKAVDHFDQMLQLQYGELVNDSARLHRAQRYARGQVVVSALNTFLSLTRDSDDSGYEWVYRLSGLAPRLERAIRSEMRQGGPGAAYLAEDVVTSSSEVARFAYQGTPSAGESEECDRRREVAAWRMSVSDRRVVDHVGVRAAKRVLDNTEPLSSFQARLGDREALVHYWRYRDRYVAWVVTRNGAPVRVELGAAERIEKLVREFQEAVRSDLARPSRPVIARGIIAAPSRDPPRVQTPPPQPDRRRAGDELREAVWDRVAGKLSRRVQRVYLVPDAAIAAIPFAALPLARADGYLLEGSLLFSYLTTPHDLASTSAAPGAGGVLLVGDVGGVASAPRPGPAASATARSLEVLDGAASSVGSKAKAPMRPPSGKCSNRRWADHMVLLPGTRAEVLAISSLLEGLGPSWKPDVLLGPDASEEAVRRKMRGHRILHFATHGWLDQLDAQLPESFFEFVNGRQATTDAYLVSADPTLGSGLLLNATDPGSGLADGILSAMEIAPMNLDGVDLVVLSACDTAGSSQGGNGLIGLAMTFQEAGARSIVASLYPVADDETPILMASFYRSLAAGNEIEVSLRNAMLEMKAAGYGMYYWAAFVSYAAQRSAGKE